MPKVNIVMAATLALLCASVFIPHQKLARAQNPVSLFSTCVFNGSGTSHAHDVVIGREVFTSIRSMWAYGSRASCRVRPSSSDYKFGTLRLAFGVPDSDAEHYGFCRKPIVLNVYLDGNLYSSAALFPGEGEVLLADISRTSSVTLEVPTVGSCWSTIHFVQAILEPI